MCLEVDKDPWGTPYKLLMKRLGRQSPALEDHTLLTITQGLFPALQPIDWTAFLLAKRGQTDREALEGTDNESFTTDELLTAVNCIPMGKAPGPDLVPNEIIKLAAHRYPRIFLASYNSCIAEGHYLEIWKRAKLVLLYKDQGKTVTYRLVTDRSASWTALGMCLRGCY
jgi:hypothetical protein